MQISGEVMVQKATHPQLYSFMEQNGKLLAMIFAYMFASQLHESKGHSLSDSPWPLYMCNCQVSLDLMTSSQISSSQQSLFSKGSHVILIRNFLLAAPHCRLLPVQCDTTLMMNFPVISQYLFSGVCALITGLLLVFFFKWQMWTISPGKE